MHDWSFMIVWHNYNFGPSLLSNCKNGPCANLLHQPDPFVTKTKPKPNPPNPVHPPYNSTSPPNSRPIPSLAHHTKITPRPKLFPIFDPSFGQLPPPPHLSLLHSKLNTIITPTLFSSATLQTKHYPPK